MPELAADRRHGRDSEGRVSGSWAGREVGGRAVVLRTERNPPAGCVSGQPGARRWRSGLGSAAMNFGGFLQSCPGHTAERRATPRSEAASGRWLFGK